MANILKISRATVKIYHGYGHQDNIVLYGHVLLGKPRTRKRFSTNIFTNIIQLLKLFLVHPVPDAKVRLNWEDCEWITTTAADGFFKFEFNSKLALSAGWHDVKVYLLNNLNEVTTHGEGKFFVPHSTQFAFISDIDDTVLISHAATKLKRLRTLFTRNPRTRKSFVDVVDFYQRLALSYTNAAIPNPFFYVSSSEWNLYDDLEEFFKHNHLPAGAFLLNEIKRWYELLSTGKTKHQGKLLRVVRVIEAFPKQKFILLGDNSQHDPDIYKAIANKYPDRIEAIFIRNILQRKSGTAKLSLNSVENKQIFTCLFNETADAIRYATSIKLIS